MRCYRSARGFANDFRRRNGDPAPEQSNTKYVIEYDDGHKVESNHAPSSYQHITKAVFVVDGVGMAIQTPCTKRTPNGDFPKGEPEVNDAERPRIANNQDEHAKSLFAGNEVDR